MVNKEVELVPFRLNDGQKMVHQQLENQLKEQGKIRALILKARQVGISTYVEGRFFWKITQTRNANAFVLSHLAESTNAIFNMVRMFYDRAASSFQANLSSQSAATLVFDEINSRYQWVRHDLLRQGEDKPRFVHGSVAFYPQGADIVAGLLQTVGGSGSGNP